MYAIRRAVFEFLVLGAIGVALGFGVNAVRAKSIKPTKNYFDTNLPAHIVAARTDSAALEPDLLADAIAADRHTAANTPAAAVGTGISGGSPATPELAAQAESASQGPVKKAGHVKHDYQSIDFKAVAEVFEDPATGQGLNLFVDARNDDGFVEGHIPGAVQCDPYRVEHYLENVLARTNGVDKIIVYCNGGNCDDSIFMCRELVAAGVPYESVYLFEGGWEEWTLNNMPVAKPGE